MAIAEGAPSLIALIGLGAPAILLIEAPQDTTQATSNS
jgi:hypothetical protein